MGPGTSPVGLAGRALHSGAARLWAVTLTPGDGLALGPALPVHGAQNTAEIISNACRWARDPLLGKGVAAAGDAIMRGTLDSNQAMEAAAL